MENIKKALILTVTAGNGHNACAKAMAAQLTKAGVEVKIIDFLKEWSDGKTVWTVDKGYNIAVANFLPTYNASYRRLNRRPPERRYMIGWVQKVALSAIEPLLKEVYAFQPDIIYCTHVYPAIALSDLRMFTPVPAKIYVTTFDFTLCPFWECCIGVDYINLATEDMRQELVRRGYKEEQFVCCGVPVDEKFLAPIPKDEARAKFGMQKDLFTVMIMFGGGQWNGGYKLLRQVVRALRGVPAQIVMINGHNKHEKEKIDKKLKRGAFKEHKIVNVGFTNEVEQYMAASDVIVNKLGGTSATECINRLLPVIAARKLLPQQEADNADYLSERGAVLTYRNQKELNECLWKLRNDKEFYEGMRAAMEKLRKGGVKALAEHALAQPRADYSQIKPVPETRLKQFVTKLLKQADHAEKKENR